MPKIRKEQNLRKTTVDIPVKLYKELHIVIAEKYNATYGHLGESIIAGIVLWIKKNKPKQDSDLIEPR